MRRTLLFPVFALAVAACAPRVQGPELSPLPAGPEIQLSGGPEGESAVPSADGGGPRNAARRPALATAAVVTSPNLARAAGKLRDKELMIPVAGVGAEKIEDTFTASRDGGDRQHNAVDILAPRNTPIVAADDGTILRLSTNALGGITIYAADRDQEFVYYYAHLERYHDGLAVGKSIRKGETIGYVGTTGNAPKDVPHLHFQVMLWPADGKWWNGEPVNPYAALRGPVTSGGNRLRFD